MYFQLIQRFCFLISVSYIEFFVDNLLRQQIKIIIKKK